MSEFADTESADIVIVEAGPTGLTVAHLCRRLGLSAIVLEKREGPQRAPEPEAVMGVGSWLAVAGRRT